MAAPPALVSSSRLVRVSGAPSGPMGWLLGGVAALPATVVAGVVAVLFAAALAVVAVLAFLLVLLTAAVVRARSGRAAAPAVLSARWTGYGWDAR